MIKIKKRQQEIAQELREEHAGDAEYSDDDISSIAFLRAWDEDDPTNPDES